MSLGNILEAINTSYGAYNGNTANMYDAKVKGAQYKDTLMNTKLKNQSHSQNELMNPMLAIAQELTNKIKNQSLDFNANNNPYLLDKSRLANETAQQSLGFNEANNPFLLDEKRLANVKSQNQIDSRNAFIGNSLNSPQELNNYHGTAGNSQYNPTNANKLNMGQTLVDIATGGGNPVTYQGKQYEGQDQLDALNKVIRSLMTSSKSGTTKPTIIKTGEYMNAVFNDDGSVTPIGSPMGLGNRIRQSLTQFSEDQKTDNEFDTKANDENFWKEADSVYQSFLTQGMSEYEAEVRTNKIMMPQIENDDDFWNNEYKYVPKHNAPFTPNNEPFGGQQAVQLNSKAEFDALPIGTAYRLPNGQTGVK